LRPSLGLSDLGHAGSFFAEDLVLSNPVARLNAALAGRYRVEREIGAGGMATVYLADDLKHERKVALKVLKPELAAIMGAERFLAEIKTTANLQHPHILPLHDSGEADGFLYYVMPYIEGETLRDRLGREKQLPVEEAVQIAKDVADALHAAHEQGVIHRDIKPANILLSRGRPLVADFGIALAVDAAGGGRLTETGLSLGTPHYMSPEQATGELHVGPATDIYALGCVLYEMLVGEPPYTGSTAQAILGKIIAGEVPSATGQRASVPGNVDAAIRRALEKLPADRFTSADAFGNALSDPGFRHGGAGLAVASQDASTDGPGQRRSLASWGLAVVLGLVAAWGWLRPGPQAPSSAPLLADLIFPTDSGPTTGGFALSPDGTELAFVTEPRLDGGRIWIRSLESGQRRPLPNTERAESPAWSPDGARIAFRSLAGDQILAVPAEGGPTVTLARFPSGVGLPSWMEDGRVVFVAEEGIWSASPTGGQPVELLPRGTLENPFIDALVAPLPDNLGYVVGTGGRGGSIYAGDFDSGAHELLLESNRDPRYVDGWLVSGGSRLFAQRFDPRSKTLSGDLVPLAAGIAAPGSRSQFAVRGNTLVYATRSARTERWLHWLDAGATTAIPEALQPDGWMHDLSRDGTRIASGGFSLFVTDSDGGIPRRIERAGDVAFHPRWSEDGTALLYRGSGGHLHRIGTNPGDAPVPLVPLADGVDELRPVGWGPHGEVLFIAYFTDGSTELQVLDTGAGEVRALLPRAEEAALSPDGRWLAYVSAQGGSEPQVFVRAYPGTDEVRISIDGGRSPTWGPDGDQVYFVTPSGEPSVVSLSFEGRLTNSAPVVVPVGFAVERVMAHPEGRLLLDVSEGALTSLKVLRDWQGLVSGGG